LRSGDDWVRGLQEEAGQVDSRGMDTAQVSEEVVVRGAMEFLTSRNMELTRGEADALIAMLQPFGRPWAGEDHSYAPTHLDHALSFLEEEVLDPSEALYGLIEYMGAAGLWTDHEATSRALYEQEAATAFGRDLGEHVTPDDDPTIDLDVVPFRGRHRDEG
jgi:hypothetical protein